MVDRFLDSVFIPLINLHIFTPIHTTLIILTLWQVLKLGSLPTLFSFSTVWAILNSLHFHINFGIELSILKKPPNSPGTLIWGSSVSIYGQATPFHLFMSS